MHSGNDMETKVPSMKNINIEVSRTNTNERNISLKGMNRGKSGVGGRWITDSTNKGCKRFFARQIRSTNY